MGRPGRYSPEVWMRAFRMVLEHQGEHESQWAARLCSGSVPPNRPDGVRPPQAVATSSSARRGASARSRRACSCTARPSAGRRSAPRTPRSLRGSPYTAGTRESPGGEATPPGDLLFAARPCCRVGDLRAPAPAERPILLEPPRGAKAPARRTSRLHGIRRPAGALARFSRRVLFRAGRLAGQRVAPKRTPYRQPSGAFMSTVEFDGKEYEVNAEGFMVHPEEWTEDLARFLAREEEKHRYAHRAALGRDPVHPPALPGETGSRR